MLFAKALTNSDCCLNISKSGRITLPRVAVEQNLPAVNNRKHNEVVSALDVGAERCALWAWALAQEGLLRAQVKQLLAVFDMQEMLDEHDVPWKFVIKSWPNGSENKRVYVMERTGVCWV